MARGSEREPRPISFAELMARAKEEGATDVADAAATSPAATGRRRRGGKDAVSVAELTGEIPRIGGKSSTPKPDAPADPPSEATAASDQDIAAPRRGDYDGQETREQPKVEAEPEPTVEREPAAEPDHDHTAEETTGVIASVQAYSQVDENNDDHRALSAAEREREFERYRNFEDEDFDETPARAAEPKKRKRGLFGRGRKDTAAQAAPPAEAAPDHPDNADHEVTQLIPMVTAPQPPTTAPEEGYGDQPPVPVPVEVPDPQPESTPSPAARPADTGRYLRFDIDDDTPAQDTDAVRLTESAASRTDSGSDLAPDDEAPDEASPTVQWLVLIGQVLAGLAVGVALFWGFTELWRWNVYFALVLAVAVIFGLVTLVHVVRRSQDLISTLLALGVGLVVTIGPLVLLLVAGD